MDIYPYMFYLSFKNLQYERICPLDRYRFQFVVRARRPDADAEEARSSIHGDDDDVHAVDPRCRRVIEASVSREDDEDSVSETKKISNCIPTDDDDDDAVRGESER
jgi:hypothetical protein